MKGTINETSSCTICQIRSKPIESNSLYSVKVHFRWKDIMINSVKCLFWIMKNHSINWAFNIDRGFVNKAWLATLPRSILKAQSSVASRRPVQHDTGATFAPEWVHSGSLSWLYICLRYTTTKCRAGASHPGVSSPRLLYLRYEISQRYHVNAKQPHVSVWNRSACRLERVAHS